MMWTTDIRGWQTKNNYKKRRRRRPDGCDGTTMAAQQRSNAHGSRTRRIIRRRTTCAGHVNMYTHTRHGVISTRYSARGYGGCDGGCRPVGRCFCWCFCRCAYLFDLVLALYQRVRKQLHWDRLRLGHGFATQQWLLPSNGTDHPAPFSSIVDSGHMHRRDVGVRTHVSGASGPVDDGAIETIFFFSHGHVVLPPSDDVRQIRTNLNQGRQNGTCGANTFGHVKILLEK